jgi:uncharacterized protein (DUF1330 family)
MRTYLSLSAGMAAGLVIGGFAVQGLHAQSKPPIYYVSEIDISDPDAYGKEFAPKMQALIKQHGGTQVAIGGVAGVRAKSVTAFDGEAPKRAVVQTWPSLDKLQAWRNDPQWKELRQAATNYAKWRSYAIEGTE